MLSALLAVTCLMSPSKTRVQFQVNLDQKIEYLQTYDEEKIEAVNFKVTSESVSSDLKKVSFHAEGDNGEKLLFDLEVRSQTHYETAHVILKGNPYEASCYVADQNDE